MDINKVGVVGCGLIGKRKPLVLTRVQGFGTLICKCRHLRRRQGKHLIGRQEK